jgi:hypothetical protein
MLNNIYISEAAAIPVPKQIREVARYIGCLENAYTPF